MTDIVITYVTADDSEWAADYTRTFHNIPNSERFFDWRFLRFILRGIETNMSWVNKVHLVVARDSQVPTWINRDKVNVVTHDQIIPSGLLPTFNSCAIEMFLHNIPGLAEQYIYINDDTIPLNPSKESDYFDNGVARTNIGKHIVKSNRLPGSYLNQCLNSTQIVLDELGIKTEKCYLKPAHSCTTFLKSSCTKLYNNQKQHILKSITKKRSADNFNQYMYLAYMKLTNKLINSRLSHKYTSFSEDIYNIAKMIEGGNYHWICINDNNCDASDRIRYRGILSTALSKKFVKQSSYEINGIQTIKSIQKVGQTISAKRRTQTQDPVDFIFPYVTMDDPEWQAQYKQYCPKTETEWAAWAAGVERYRDYGMLKYMFRSVAQNMPWVNKLHMIVSSESQVPSWVNRDTVNIITHKDFIPEEHLPTFNSCTIEMFLPLIKGLSDRFIYSNDDVYITKPVTIGNFFSGKKPTFHLTKRTFRNGAINDPIRKTALQLAGDPTGGKFIYDTQHICLPHIKSNMLKLYRQKTKEIHESCSKFRKKTNSNQYMYLYYQAFHNSYIDKPINVLTTCIDARHQAKYKQNYSLFQVCCLNDSNESKSVEMKYVHDKLDKMFPKKCKYEK